jgi:hypothetical protein
LDPGRLNAFLAKSKHRDKDTALIGLLTIYIEYCREGLKFDYTDYKDEIDQVLRSNKRFGSILLSVSYKEVEEVISSKVIIMKGILMNTIDTISVDAKKEK